MQASKKIIYIYRADLIFATLIILSALIGSVPYLTESSTLPLEFKIWREDALLFPFLVFTKSAYVLLGVGICKSGLGLREKFERSRSRVILLMCLYLLIHCVETVVKIFVYYPKLSFSIEGGGAIGGAFGSVIGFALVAVIPIITIMVLRRSDVRLLFTNPQSTTSV